MPFRRPDLPPIEMIEDIKSKLQFIFQKFQEPQWKIEVKWCKHERIEYDIYAIGLYNNITEKFHPFAIFLYPDEFNAAFQIRDNPEDWEDSDFQQ